MPSFTELELAVFLWMCPSGAFFVWYLDAFSKKCGYPVDHFLHFSYSIILLNVKDLNMTAAGKNCIKKIGFM